MCLYPRVMQVKRKGNDFCEPVQVVCGRCLECLSKKSTEWAFRLMDEAKLHKDNCFITLTYNNEHYPVDGNVSRRDVQLFMKRLRKKLGNKRIRYFYCGEYGAKRGRPHYHIILFGFCPDDLIFFFEKDGVKYYLSDFIADIWSNGNILVNNELSLKDTKYCAKYLQKLNKQVTAQGSAEPFVGMSNRPGIGAGAFDDKCLVTDKIYNQGKSINVPRYYLKLAEKDGWDLQEFHDRRLTIAEALQATQEDLRIRRKKAQEFFTKKY